MRSNFDGWKYSANRNLKIYWLEEENGKSKLVGRKESLNEHVHELVPVTWQELQRQKIADMHSYGSKLIYAILPSNELKNNHKSKSRECKGEQSNTEVHRQRMQTESIGKSYLTLGSSPTTIGF